MQQTNQTLPDWLKNASVVTKKEYNGKPNTQAGQILLNRFSETSDPETGLSIKFTPDEAANNCRAHYTLSQKSIDMITGENLDKCFPTANYRPVAPTIKVMRDAFGDDMVRGWLNDHIEMLSEYVGGKTKIDPMRMTLISTMIAEKFSDGRNTLNAREVMLFFFMVIKGDLGHFYGAVEPVALGDMASQFLEWRHKQLARVSIEEEEALRKKRTDEMNKNAAPMPEEARKALLGLYSTFVNNNKTK